MKIILLFACSLTLLLSCSSKVNKQSEILGLDEIAKFALNKPVGLVADSLRLDANKMAFVDEPPGIISSVVVDYQNKGTMELFFQRTSIITYNLNRKEEYLNRVADKIINEVDWKDFKGKKVQ